MSKLNDLIKNLCPRGVEFKTLGEVAKIFKGVQFNKTNMKNVGTFPVINGGVTPSGYIEKYNQDENTITISQGGASAGYVNWISKKFWAGAHCYIIKPLDGVINRYIFHFLKSQEKKLQECQYGAGIPALSRATVENLKIPIPPLEVQKEIVRILDTFTELIEKLSEELTLRKKQYEFYRDKLLTFGNEVEFKKLGELFEFKNGLNKEKSAFGKGTPIINFMDVYKNRWLANGKFFGLVEVTESEISRYSAKKGDIFFTRTSETKEDIGMSSTLIEDVPDCVFSGFVLRGRPKTNLLDPKFCAYYFSTSDVRNEIIRHAAFTTRATTTGEKLSKIKIPVPPIEEQERIVKILDRFDKLCNDISEGLPAEISLRKKQYEFYRDKLLTFEELKK